MPHGGTKAITEAECSTKTCRAGGTEHLGAETSTWTGITRRTKSQRPGAASTSRRGAHNQAGQSVQTKARSERSKARDAGVVYESMWPVGEWTMVFCRWFVLTGIGVKMRNQGVGNRSANVYAVHERGTTTCFPSFGTLFWPGPAGELKKKRIVDSRNKIVKASW